MLPVRRQRTLPRGVAGSRRCEGRGLADKGSFDAAGFKHVGDPDDSAEDSADGGTMVLGGQVCGQRRNKLEGGDISYLKAHIENEKGDVKPRESGPFLEIKDEQKQVHCK